MATSQYLLGIDLGTSVVKTAIFDLNGRALSITRREYPIESPFPGWATQDPQIWWIKTIETIKEAIETAKIASAQITGIGVCGQGHGPTPLTKEGRILDHCIIWPDRRSAEQVKWVRNRLGPEHGNPTYTAVKILWWKQERPQIYQTADMFLLPTNFIVYKLTDQFVTDYTNASATDMYNIEAADWSDSLLEVYGIPREKLPRVCDPWEVIGEVTQKAARETGLKKGTPVIPGGGDWACTFYGAGYVKPGRAVDMTGTVCALNIAQAAPHSIKYQCIVPMIVHRKQGGSQTAGVIYRWFRDQFGMIEPILGEAIPHDDYQRMDQEAASSTPGLLLTPHFLGEEHWGIGVRYGLLFGLTLDTTRGQIIRAIMEGLAYELRRRLWGESSVDTQEIRAIGGGAKSSIWRQIKADIIGVPYSTINIDEGGCFGAAMLAGVGVGHFHDVISPIETFVRVIERNEPRMEFQHKYNELYKLYCKIHQVLDHSNFYEEYNATLKQLGLRFAGNK